MYSDFERQLDGNRLVTLHIFYRLPDYRQILRDFIWQLYDLPPDFPRVFAYLDFWKAEVEGPLHSVEIHYPELMIVPNVEVQQRKIRLEY